MIVVLCRLFGISNLLGAQKSLGVVQPLKKVLKIFVHKRVSLRSKYCLKSSPGRQSPACRWPTRSQRSPPPQSATAPSPTGRGQRECFFQSRDESESFSYSISFIKTRPRIPDTYSQASRQDREKISSNLGHRDEIEIYYLHSQTSRREREFP